MEKLSGMGKTFDSQETVVGQGHVRSLTKVYVCEYYSPFFHPEGQALYTTIMPENYIAFEQATLFAPIHTNNMLRNVG